MNEPIYAQFLMIKGQYPEAIVLMRLGDFLETFNEDAEELGRLLDIKPQKIHGKLGLDHWMNGFPVALAEQYIGKLIGLGRKVAVAEQVENPTEKKLAAPKAKKVFVQQDLFEQGFPEAS